MNKPLLFFSLFVLFSCFSCIPTKRLAYLQQDSKDVDAEFTITKKPDPYRVQVNDLLSIRIKSLDQSEVGMFNPVGCKSSAKSGLI